MITPEQAMARIANAIFGCFIFSVSTMLVIVCLIMAYYYPNWSPFQ